MMLRTKWLEVEVLAGGVFVRLGAKEWWFVRKVTR